MSEHEIVNGLIFHVSAQDFMQIPGSPIAYNATDNVLKIFKQCPSFGKSLAFREGIHTANNFCFLCYWHEIDASKITYHATSIQEVDKSGRYVPYCKGGEFRRWYGNLEYVIKFDNCSRQQMQKQKGCVWPSKALWFHAGGTWTAVSTGDFGVRYFPDGCLFDAGGQVCIGDNLIEAIAVLNTSLYQFIADLTMPTINYKCGIIKTLPDLRKKDRFVVNNVQQCINISKIDWDSHETSWDYQQSALLSQSHDGSIEHAIASLSQQWQTLSEEQRQREIRNNELVADAYGVRDDVPCDVPLERVSLKRNSAFVYPDKTPAERDELFARDVVKEFISYAVGCMFGRYSIDKPGLILASQGETVDDFHERVPNTRFEPDRDNVIPVTEVDCFEDDIVSRFRRFLEVTFGSEHLAENLAYIERTLGKPLRKYFVNDFYNDHVAMYKNRPIYWQYSSRTDNKGAFKALIYMHRYTPATTHTVLEYLRDFTVKIEDQANQLERSDRAKDKREAEKLHKAVTECKAYEDNVLYPLATRNLAIDLDDGVLVNYLRMGQALRAIPTIEKKRKDVATWTWPVHPLRESR